MSALCQEKEKETILTSAAETSTQNVTAIIRRRIVIRAISHIVITAKREMTAGRIIQRGGPTITVVASTQIGTRTLAPGAAAETRGDGTGGILNLFPAVAPLQQNGDPTTTSLVERGNTKQDIWRNRLTTHFPNRAAKVTPPLH